jgi:hypothetical protein
MVNITFYKRKKKHFRYLLEQEESSKYKDEKRIRGLELKIDDCNKRIREMKKK